LQSMKGPSHFQAPDRILPRFRRICASCPMRCEHTSRMTGGDRRSNADVGVTEGNFALPHWGLLAYRAINLPYRSFTCYDSVARIFGYQDELDRLRG
jgi:hypothetical protein